MVIEVEHDYATGERNGNSKLTAEKAKAIKKSKGQISASELGEIYNVSRYTIYRIWKEETWKEVKI